MKRLISAAAALVMVFGTLLTATAETVPDFDLSVMSNVMQTSLIAQLIEKPQMYEGKTVKVRGYFSSLFNRQKNSRSYFGNVVDMRACCFSDGSYIFDLLIDAPEDMELPAEGQLCDMIGVLEKNFNYNVLHIESIELLDGNEEDIKW